MNQIKTLKLKVKLYIVTVVNTVKKQFFAFVIFKKDFERHNNV